MNIAENIIHTGDPDTKISFPSNDTIRFDVAGSQTNYIQLDNEKTVFMRPIMVGDYVSHSGISAIGIKFFNAGTGNNNTFVGLGAEDNGTSGGENHKTFQVFRQGSSVNRVNIDNSGNLNIVSGSLTLPDSIIHTGDTDTKIRFPADDTISFETAGSERLRIASNGNVELGSAAGTGSDFSLLDGVIINAANGDLSLIHI